MNDLVERVVTEKIKDLQILVVGDIMLDKYVVGDVARISPEAPVPIVTVFDEYSTLGGCGNVVRNISEIGARVFCGSSIANDSAGKEIISKLAFINCTQLTTYNSRKTIVKERIIADQRKVQMLRIDREHIQPIDPKDFIDEYSTYNQKFDIIVVSDYAKGMITWEMMEFLRSTQIPMIIDPKPQNAYMYGRPLMLTPNKKEWMTMESEDQCDAEFVLVTEGQIGMTLYDKRQGLGKLKIPAKPVEVYNVSGAGDTVVSVMAVCLALDIHPERAARIANECAGFVVTQPGTTVIPKNKFMNIMQKYIIK
jgi:rfaE bifunctional protein kinase chain/domain